LRTGFIAGVLNGLIGIGGGIVIVPAMIRRGATPQQAVGTSLATVVVLSGAAFLVHVHFTGMVLGGTGLAAVVGAGILGSVAGGWILARLSAKRMLVLFAVLIFSVSLRLVLQGLGIASPQPVWPGDPSLLGYMSVGFASGILSGVLGVGGGALVMLGLTVLFGMPVHAGLPVALAVNVTNAIAGALRHAMAGRVRRTDVTSMVPAALVGIGVGTTMALWLPPDGLRLVFGAFFCFMGIRIARQALRR
jgi:uncharacterized membrane protein YfcA